jgi:hypothetical protein
VELLNNDVKANAAGRRRARSVVELTGELRAYVPASAAAPGGGRGVLRASGHVLCRRPVNHPIYLPRY